MLIQGLFENSVKFVRNRVRAWRRSMSDIVADVAGALFRSGCLRFGTFKIKSGALSPYYIDLAGLLSSPKELCTIASIAADRIKEHHGH